MSDEPLRIWQVLRKKILGHCLVKNIGKALFVVFNLPNLWYNTRRIDIIL